MKNKKKKSFSKDKSQAIIIAEILEKTFLRSLSSDEWAKLTKLIKRFGFEVTKEAAYKLRKEKESFWYPYIMGIIKNLLSGKKKYNRDEITKEDKDDLIDFDNLFGDV